MTVLGESLPNFVPARARQFPRTEDDRSLGRFEAGPREEVDTLSAANYAGCAGDTLRIDLPSAAVDHDLPGPESRLVSPASEKCRPGATRCLRLPKVTDGDAGVLREWARFGASLTM
jgi:hypothetical protein